ncbi:hypothetical protein XENOCAPTIV_011566, partial [Xenoophorus captivus]
KSMYFIAILCEVKWKWFLLFICLILRSDWFLSVFLSVLNESSQEELSIRDVRILPNLNASYLPMMPDGSVLLVDNVWYVPGSGSLQVSVSSRSKRSELRSVPLLVCSHQSGEVGMGSFCRVDSRACRLPSMLCALEEHDFLFQLHLNDVPQDDSNEVSGLVNALWVDGG